MYTFDGKTEVYAPNPRTANVQDTLRKIDLEFQEKAKGYLRQERLFHTTKDFLTYDSFKRWGAKNKEDLFISVLIEPIELLHEFIYVKLITDESGRAEARDNLVSFLNATHRHVQGLLENSKAGFLERLIHGKRYELYLSNLRYILSEVPLTKIDPPKKP